MSSAVLVQTYGWPARVGRVNEFDRGPRPISPITSNSAADATRWVQYSHSSLLATVEAIFNLGTLGRNDTSATPMSDLFRGGIP